MLEEAARYVAFADRWQWPPAVVDELPAWLHERMLIAATVKDELEAERQERRAAAAKSDAGRPGRR